MCWRSASATSSTARPLPPPSSRTRKRAPRRRARTPAADQNGHLAHRAALAQSENSMEEPVVDREEVLLIMGMIGDIRADVAEIRRTVTGENDGEEEEDA